MHQNWDLTNPQHSVAHADTIEHKIDQASVRGRLPFFVLPKKEPFIPEVFKINGVVVHAEDQHMGPYTS